MVTQSRSPESQHSASSFGETELPREMSDLAEKIAALPEPLQRDLQVSYNHVVESVRRRRRILALVQEALAQLRLDIKYLMFDLEVTRKERDEFKAFGQGSRYGRVLAAAGRWCHPRIVILLFRGGDAHVLYRSIRRILDLPPETRLFTGHDYAPNGRRYAWESTVAEQRASNVHVHDGVTEEEFVAMRTARDAKLDMPKLILPSVQVNMRAGNLPPPEDNGVRYLKIPIDRL